MASLGKAGQVWGTRRDDTGAAGFFLLTLSFSSQGQLVTRDYPTYALAAIGLLVASSTMCIPLVALGTFVVRRLRGGDTAPVA